MGKKSRANNRTEIVLEVEFISFMSKTMISGRNKLYGTCKYNDVIFAFSLVEQKTKYPYYRGTISAKNKSGYVAKVLDKNKPASKAISKAIHIHNSKINIIKEKIASSVKRLYSVNSIILESERVGRIRADNITPAIALSKYGESFVTDCHRKANSNTQAQAMSTLYKAVDTLANIAMKDFKTNDIKKLFESGSLKKKELNELRKFWNYCLCNRHCLGDNPVYIPPRIKTVKQFSKKKYIRIDQLFEDQENQFYEHINNNFTAPNVGVALMLGGGLTSREIIDLKWGDLQFISSNFVILKIYFPERSGATKTFSRPFAPRAARLLNRLYHEMLESYTQEELFDMPVITYKKKNMKYNIDALNKQAKSLIIDNYISFEQFKILSNENLDFSAATRILNNTYKYDLSIRCRLEDDPGSLKYLLGNSLGSDITSDCYRSFSSPAGIRHLYELMLILDEEKENSNPLITNQRENHYINILTPPTTHSMINATFDILLEPGDEIILNNKFGLDCQIQSIL